MRLGNAIIKGERGISERIVQLYEEIVKGAIKELVQGQVLIFKLDSRTTSVRLFSSPV